MFNSCHLISHRLVTLTVTTSLLVPTLGLNLNPPVVQALTSDYCQTTNTEASQKEALLTAAVNGTLTAKQRYQARLEEDALKLQRCRNQSWLKTQAIWLRLHDCDLRPGVLDGLMDRIVNRGYNQVYVEVFYQGRVLLPTADNPSPWSSAVRESQYTNRDLLAEAIRKGRERGLKVYAWLFSLNYGYTYGIQPERQPLLARNGLGQTSLNLFNTSQATVELSGDLDAAFIDPYNPQARRDYNSLLQAVLQRRPDGVLFDYIRYPRQQGGASVATKISDLWIYGDAAQAALLSRATNQKGRFLIQKYIEQGKLTLGDITQADTLYPQEGPAQWQGRKVDTKAKLPPPQNRLYSLQRDLWLLGVAHAYQGVLDFLRAAAYPVQRQRLPAGAVFFPDANRRVGQGFDSRMQPWDYFPKNIEWHAMSYGVCGDTSCIVDQVKRVAEKAEPNTHLSPVIAGAWTGFAYNRPSLVQQMEDIRQAVPEIKAISHFDFSWQDPQFANARRSCRISYESASQLGEPQAGLGDRVSPTSSGIAMQRDPIAFR